jgi:hypothetical protein
MTWYGGKPAHKYGARKTTCAAGHEHPSKKEARHCDDLHLLQRAGEISELEVEPRYYFEVNGRTLTHEGGRRACFTPDFRYRRRDGRIVVDEVKAASKLARARDYPLRKALFRACYPEIEMVES